MLPSSEYHGCGGTAQAAGRGDRRRRGGEDADTTLVMLTLGATPQDVAALAAIREPERFRYHSLGTIDTVADPGLCRPREVLPALVAAARRLTSAPRGVLAFDDYPASPLAVLLAAELGLPGPSVHRP